MRDSRIFRAHGRRAGTRRPHRGEGLLALGLALCLTTGMTAGPPLLRGTPPTAVAGQTGAAVPPDGPPAAAGDGTAGAVPSEESSAEVRSPPDPPVPPAPAVRPVPPVPTLPAVGSIVTNPGTGRPEVVVPDIRTTAVLIGDSQATLPTSWPQVALTSLGYQVAFSGAGGTGFVARNNEIDAPSYQEALSTDAWTLPHGNPALVVIEGGGNDAAQGVSDGEIVAAADGLIRELQRTYPLSRVVLIGTLSRSAADGGGRRSEVDALLGGLAASLDIPFVSPGAWLTEHRLEDQLADGVHLTPEGDAHAAVILEQNLRALKLDPSYTARRITSEPGDHTATQ
jgi:acyl-CoA thioesterase-1